MDKIIKTAEDCASDVFDLVDEIENYIDPGEAALYRHTARKLMDAIHAYRTEA